MAITEGVAWAPPVLVVGVLTGLYALGLARRRPRGWGPWRHRRTAAFVGGAVTLGVGLSPLPELVIAGHAQRHVAEHLLISMLAPVGLALGAPVRLLLGAVGPTHGRAVGWLLRRRAVHVLAHPLTAAALATASLYALYTTPLFALSVTHHGVHRLVHVHMVLTGYLLAWSVAGPDPAPRRPGHRVRALALVLSAGAHAYLAKLIYARAPDLPPGAGLAAEDLRAAARWMYYGGDVAEAALALTLVAAWLSTGRHRRQEASVRAVP